MLLQTSFGRVLVVVLVLVTTGVFPVTVMVAVVMGVVAAYAAKLAVGLVTAFYVGVELVDEPW